MSWEQLTLGELVKGFGGLIQTGPFGAQLKQSEYTDEGVPVIMPTNISDGRINVGSIARVLESTAVRLARHRIKPDTIVFPRRGEITKRAYVTEEQSGWLCGTGCLKIEAPENVIFPKFLYYQMGTADSVDWLQKNAVGATMLNLSGEILARYPVRFPDLSTQQRIASILSAYDDLIENNRRRIGLLEQAARLLYREWFVHFRFPGHETAKFVDGLPEEWIKTTVGAHCPLIYGKALKAETRIDGSFDVYGSSGIVGTHNKALVTDPAIIVGRKGNVGSIYWARCGCWPIDTVYFVDPINSDFFTYYTLQHITFQSTDVAVPGLNRDYAHSREIRLPTKALVQAFNDRASVFLRQAELLSSQNEKLTRARDLLLPRLMDGRIPV